MGVTFFALTLAGCLLADACLPASAAMLLGGLAGLSLLARRGKG